MKVPRSKVKTDYLRLLFCLVFVIESDLSFRLSHPNFALGFVLVAGRWRATGPWRAHGPTSRSHFSEAGMGFAIKKWLHFSIFQLAGRGCLPLKWYAFQRRIISIFNVAASGFISV